MAFRLLPRTRENTTTVGTGSLTLTGAAAPNNQTFASQMSEGDQTFACAISSDGTAWEEGLYTMTSGQLARTGARLANNLGTTANIAMNGGRVFAIIPHDLMLAIQKLLSPTDGQVIKYVAGTGFVAAGAGGPSWHQAVALATAVALPANTYSNGSSGVGATLTGNSNGALTVDGVATVLGYRILVKNEASSPHNGIYVVTVVGDGSHPYVLTRAPDHDDMVDIAQADTTAVGTAGTANAKTIWVSTLASPFVIGTDTMTWSLVVAGDSLPGGGTDGDVLTRVSGSPAWAAPATSGRNWSAKPTQAGTGFNSWFSWDAAARVADTPLGIMVSDGGGFLQLLKMTPPSPPYAYDLFVTSQTKASTGIAHAQFGFGDSGGHKTSQLRMWANYNTTRIIIDHWLSNNTSANTVVYGGDPDYIACLPGEWFRIENDGTNLNFYWSPDGDPADFRLLYQETITTYLTAAAYLVFGYANYSAPGAAVLRSWYRSA